MEARGGVAICKASTAIAAMQVHPSYLMLAAAPVAWVRQSITRSSTRRTNTGQRSFNKPGLTVAHAIKADAQAQAWLIPGQATGHTSPLLTEFIQPGPAIPAIPGATLERLPTLQRQYGLESSALAMAAETSPQPELARRGNGSQTCSILSRAVMVVAVPA